MSKNIFKGRCLWKKKGETAQKAVDMLSGDISSLSDEEVMILAQHRQAEARARRRARKRRWIAAAVCVAGLAGALGYTLWNNSRSNADMQSTVEIAAGPGQEIVYARLTGIRGNEITYVEQNTAQTSEAVTALIPVGTVVTTRLGTQTTFSRLAAGNNIALVVQQEDGEEIIMAVYITG